MSQNTTISKEQTEQSFESAQTQSSSFSTDETNNTFRDLAQESQPGLVAEFVDFLVHNKKWWLTPIVMVLLMVAVLVILSTTAAAPFIYTLF